MAYRATDYLGADVYYAQRPAVVDRLLFVDVCQHFLWLAAHLAVVDRLVLQCLYHDDPAVCPDYPEGALPYQFCRYLLTPYPAGKLRDRRIAGDAARVWY